MREAETRKLNVQTPAATAPGDGDDPAAEEWTPGLVRTLHLDLLRRPAFDEQRAALLAPVSHADGSPVLAAERSRTRPFLAKQLIASVDFWRRWYEEQLYYFLLVDNFAPRAEGLLSIPDELAAGTLHVRDAIHRIALSSSFDQRNPGADTFVTVVMEQIAGLAIDKHRRELEIGKALYDGKRGTFLGKLGSTQSDVVRLAIEQRSFALAFLAREHARFVHAPAPERELAVWATKFLADPRVFSDLLLGWIASADYGARLGRREPMDNRLFVRALIVDVCQREPSAEEFSRMRSALDGLSDPLPLRSVMARLLLDSDASALDAPRSGRTSHALVGELFERLLGREPCSAESEAFSAALDAPQGSPRLLAYALLTHPEYQSY